jgi:quinate dehydrogenase (quinone)
LIAVDADSGKERWRFDPKAADTGMWNRCRGVSYFDAAAFAAKAAPADTAVAATAATAATAPGAPAAPAAPAIGAAPMACATRIVMSTIDDRLIQLDAKTGQLCAGFGDGGTVDLRSHMGEIKKAFYFTTSAPTVANGLIVIGGWVQDNQAVDEPSGVVRAFHADTGKLAWAWDLGNPAITGEPPAGQTYTRGTPNMWSTPAFDEKLGLIYLPLGNSPPDYFGGHRSAASEQYGSAIVALDINTGRERWKFQTMHHDLWDYDLPSQPALYDLPDGKGGVTPALVQLTKSGNIFMVDRRDGKALAEVKEMPAPQQPVAGDFNAPTQPVSVGMPQIGAAPLSEAAMWGATPFDQLYCRIAYKQLRYDGAYTPPNVTPSLQYPGNFGGMNWGSASINEDTGLMVVNDIRMPVKVSLIDRNTYDNGPQAGVHAGGAMKGTPFGMMAVPFMSLLEVPCHAPPYGTVTGIDLKTRKIVWQRPAGTLADTVMGGVRLGLPIPLGLPTLGGSVTTRSGLVFAAGTQDFYLRALDQNSGKELWKARLPVGAQATPTVYVSPKTGKQYVIISAGGARDSPMRGDHVMAYALP